MDWTEALEQVVARTGHRRYNELCDESQPGHLEWRRRMVERATGEAPTPAAYPSLFAMARNAIGAVGRVVKAAAKGESIRVPAEVLERRRAICGSCEQFDAPAGRCRLCGCYTATKLTLAQERCPLDAPRWDRWEKPADGG